MMKNVKILIITLLLTLPNIFVAQTVSGTFFNLPQQKVYLNAYTGLYMEVLDSVMMSQDKRVDFNTSLQKGMYQIETEYGNAFDFLYDDEPVKFVVKDASDFNSVEFIGSEINMDWRSYQIIKEKTLSSMDLLKPILRDYDKKSDFYLKSKDEYETLQNLFVSVTDKLIAHDNYASTLIKVDRFMPLNLDLDFDKQRKDLINKFFNDVDFNDLSLIPTNVLTTKIIDFLSIQQVIGQSHEQQMMSFILGIDNVLYRASVNFEMYKFVFQYLIEGFNELGFEDVIDYMTRMPYSDEINCSDEQYDELKEIVEYNSRVKIGAFARNISGKTVLNKDFDLYSIDNEYTIVYFWSYTCDHCREAMEDLEPFLIDNNNFSMVAVSVKGDLKKIKNVAKKFRTDAYFYHDGLEWDSPVVDDYAVTATPSFYLLDKNKKIIYKPYDLDELINFVNIITKQ